MPGKLCQHWEIYRLTCEEFEQLRARSGGRCEICGIAEEDTPRGYLIIEHYHHQDVWFVRGLVCDRCNHLMACHDRSAVWGPVTRPRAHLAAEFHRNGWGATSELLARAAEDIPKRVPSCSRIGGYRPEIHDLEVTDD